MAEDYTLIRCRQDLVKKIQALGFEIAPFELRAGDNTAYADLALPVFRLAKETKQHPVNLARTIAENLDLTGTILASTEAVNGYVNFKLQPELFSRAVFNDYQRDPRRYGSFTLGQGKTIVIDYSSPNIAKPFSVGHLRSTVIGQALYNIFSYLGYRVIGDNHLGDWGTQFGKLLCAFELWGDSEKLKENPTLHLFNLYVRFHEEARNDKTLEARAREWFRRLETGDPVARERWQTFVKLSLAEFNRIYQLLGVSFDVILGESFYADRLRGVIERALEMGVARREKPPVAADRTPSPDEAIEAEEMVVLIPLDKFGIDVPLILQKSDGTSLYATRELATVEYRIQTWQPEMILYVVGNEQEFYFKQLDAALKLLGITTPCIHVNFGLIRLPAGRLSTREGRVILLEDVIREAIERAKALLADRELPAEEKETIARKVGIGAIKYADLSQNRRKDVVFDWNRMLCLDGDSAPYLQYAYTRTRAILRKATDFEPEHADPALLVAPEEKTLIMDIARFPETVLASAENYEPHRVANHLYRLAQDFSIFYDRLPVLKADTPQLRNSRLGLVEMTGTVIKIGLALLGIEVMERM